MIFFCFLLFVHDYYLEKEYITLMGLQLPKCQRYGIELTKFIDIFSEIEKGGAILLENMGVSCRLSISHAEFYRVKCKNMGGAVFIDSNCASVMISNSCIMNCTSHQSSLYHIFSKGVGINCCVFGFLDLSYINCFGYGIESIEFDVTQANITNIWIARSGFILSSSLKAAYDFCTFSRIQSFLDYSIRILNTECLTFNSVNVLDCFINFPGMGQIIREHTDSILFNYCYFKRSPLFCKGCECYSCFFAEESDPDITCCDCEFNTNHSFISHQSLVWVIPSKYSYQISSDTKTTLYEEVFQSFFDVINSVFQNITSSSSGGCIYMNSAYINMIIDQTLFLNSNSFSSEFMNYGGAIYFSCMISNFLMMNSCVRKCFSNNCHMGLFKNTQMDSFNLSQVSIIECSDQIDSLSPNSIMFDCGSIVINSSFNNAGSSSGMCSLDRTQISFSIFHKNNDLTYNFFCGRETRFEYTNFVQNRNKFSTFMMQYSVMDHCVFWRNIFDSSLFCTPAYNFLINCLFDKEIFIFYNYTNCTIIIKLTLYPNSGFHKMQCIYNPSQSTITPKNYALFFIIGGILLLTSIVPIIMSFIKNYRTLILIEKQRENVIIDFG